MSKLAVLSPASHGPIISREWETMPRPHRDKLAAAFDEIGRRLRACRPDVLVVVSPDHWVNFFISNLPAICIGIGDEHDGPPEPFMKKVYPHQVLKGHAAFGRHLLQTALDNDFDPTLSHRLTLDHGTCIPLWRIGVDPELPLVPILVNDLEAPMPSIRRCFAWGRLVRRAIESYPARLRIAGGGAGGVWRCALCRACPTPGATTPQGEKATPILPPPPPPPPPGGGGGGSALLFSPN